MKFIVSFYIFNHIQIWDKFILLKIIIKNISNNVKNQYIVGLAK